MRVSQPRLPLNADNCAVNNLLIPLEIHVWVSGAASSKGLSVYVGIIRQAEGPKLLKKVVIHAGFHKTGTTAIQHSLHASTEVLKAAGYRYPIVDQGTSQSGSVLALAERGWGWQARGSKVIPKRVWTKLIKQVRKGRDNMILSSEFLSELDESRIIQIKSAFDGLDCQIVFTLRAFDKLFPSTYQQALKSGSAHVYETWLEATVNDYFGEQKTGFWKRNQHAHVILRWIQIFGAENVTIITADETNPGLLFERFGELLKLPVGSLKPVADSGLNRSLLLDEIQLLRAINKNVPKSRNWNAYMTFIRKGTFEQLTTSPTGSVEAAARLRTPKKYAKKIQQIAKLEMAELKALDLRVLGDIRDLEVGTAPVGTNANLTEISIEKVANVIASYDFGLLKLISPRSMLKNWFPYFETRLPNFVYRPLSLLLNRIFR